MKHTVFNNLLILCAILFLCFCTPTSIKNKSKLNETFFSNSDIIVRDLPKDNNGKIIIDKIKHKSEEMIGLNSMENGFDSIKMRFWYWYGYNDTMQVIEIENANKKWSASQYSIKYGYNDRLDSIICYGKTVLHHKPKSGWENFIRKLFSANVLTLPSCESYYAHATDASMIDVEIATKHKYKNYLYSNPLHHEDFFGAKSMVEIMDLLEEEFNFKRIERF